MNLELNKEVLYQMYHGEKLSLAQIAKKVGGTKSQVEYLMSLYEIPTRNHSEAKQNTDKQEAKVECNEAIELVKRKVIEGEVPRDYPPEIKKNMLIPIPTDGKYRDAVLSLVISDMHIGDANHLPKCYWSAISNALEVIRNISKLYKIKGFNLILNGDITNGVDVYRYQELRNLIQRGHWQVYAAEWILKDTMAKIEEITPITDIALVKGTHDTLSSHLCLYLKRVLPLKPKYLSQGGVYNIANPISEENILFMHGYSGSAQSPIPAKMVTESSIIVDSYRQRGIKVNRICTGHTHWLSSGFIVYNLYWDVTGGFQKWELSVHQRPCGLILYLYCGGEVLAIPIRPDPIIETTEKLDPKLEYRNFSYYGEILLKHVKEIEGVE